MPVLLLILLMPLVACAQITFDPVRLDDSTALAYALPGITAGNDTLTCLWAGVKDSSVTASIRRASPFGDTLSGVLLYDCGERSGQSCPPAMTITHTASGGEARLIYHSCDATLVVRFFAADGTITDSLHRARVTAPNISRLTQGLLLAYNDFMLNEELVIRLQDDGTILREDTVAVSGVEFSFASGNYAKLVAFTINIQDMTESFCEYVYNAEGALCATDTLLLDTLATGEMDAGRVYDYRNGMLTIAAPIVAQFASPMVYTMRVVRSGDPDSVWVYTPWTVPSIPAGSHIESWSFAGGPANTGVIGYYVRDDVSVNELRIAAFDGDGVVSEAQYTLALPYAPADVKVSGLALTVMNETVYPLYALTATDSGSRGGVLLTAFPLTELLPAESRPALVPQRFALTAYPNPFNSAVRLEYRLERPSPLDVTIFDIAGREVQRFHRDTQSAGMGSLLWSARDVASGVYLARITAGPSQTAVKLLLIR